jgi:hypothetical protein
VFADVRAGDELDTLIGHLRHAPVDQMLLHLEIRNAVAQQSTDAVALFEEGHGVPGARQLLCGSHAGGTAADDRNAFAGAFHGKFGPDPALLEGLIDDGALDHFNTNRRLVDAENAGGLARGGADATGEFGKVIRRMQNADGLAPAVAVHQVVPIGNQIV